MLNPFPEAVSMKSSLQAKIDEVVAQHFPTLLNLLIVRQGSLVVERSYHEGNATASTNVKSITKSIISTLVGIALHEGYLTSLDQRLEEFFPQSFPTSGDQRKREINLRHLLTLSSGLQWDERAPTSLPSLYASADYVAHGLSLPLQHTPGEVFAYSTLDAHLLSAVLTRATGMDMLAFANQYLFGPLGSTITTWTSDPQGNRIGGSEIALTSRDLAKIGYLYLKRGKWGERQIFAEDYHAAATQTQITPGLGGYDAATYGYLWWVNTVGPYHTYYALGYGGQIICVLPDLDIIIVTTAPTNVPPEQGAGPQVFALPRQLTERIVLPLLM
ncbi:serine hydrolase domain-containing protein [Ktedonospora formicarum]|uniref:Penicillin-binding protein n=1 Tax=Ktedonospora formicarum TaxID=2778364 RepID=A0A8J3IBC7_9CHLR|nr:serine hydrolase [Ktedonospora formicarum]GHO49537.1 penicillin-binding protein [Ktedonospora formicarum]